jgi:hypothetical protein
MNARGRPHGRSLHITVQRFFARLEYFGFRAAFAI